MYYVYNGFYVFDFIAHRWAIFSTLRALLSSHIMTNTNDDDDDDDNDPMCAFKVIKTCFIRMLV